MKQLAVLTLLALTAFMLAFALPAAAAQSFTDGSGKAVAFGQDARRIVTLAPNVTEMLHYVGLGARQVGRTDFCDYPPEVTSLPSVGGFADTSLEAIIALDPDLVVAYQGNSLDLVTQLRSAGIAVIAFREAASLEDIADQMEVLSRVVGPAGRSTTGNVLTDWRARLADLTNVAYPATADAPSVFFGYPGDTAYTCSSATFISDLLARGGLANVVGETAERWPQVGAEFILAAQPDWIVTGTHCTKDETPADKRREMIAELQAGSAWGSLPAVREGQVVVLDADTLLRPGPRILDALAELKRQTVARASAAGLAN